MGRRASGKITNPYLMTKDTNPEVLAVCYAQGWCASPDYMTFEEASAVTSVGTAFRSNTSITHFEEFEYFVGVTSLDANAFRQTTNMASIVLPPTLTSMGDRAFYQSGITSIDFRNTTSFGTYTCGACASLVTAVFQSQTTSIPAAFFHSCTSLTSVTVHAIVPPTLASNAFYNTTCTIYVPSESVDSYKDAQYWKTRIIFAIE